MRRLLQAWWYAFCQLWCQLAMVIGFRYRVWGPHHVPRHGGALLVSNHQSFFDPVLVAVGLPRQVHYMARDTLFRNPLFARLIRSLNAFPLRREGVDVGALRETVARLRRGELVLVFPEGTRTQDGSIQPLRRGVELLARQGEVPIIPVVIDGAHETWPRHQLLPRPGRIRVLFGRPLSLKDLAGTSGHAVAERLGERLGELQRELRRRPGGGGGERR